MQYRCAAIAVDSQNLFCNKMAFAVHTVPLLLWMELLIIMSANNETSALLVRPVSKHLNIKLHGVIKRKNVD